MIGIGWVVNDGCAPKQKAGGPDEFARSLADLTSAPAGHRDDCPTCRLLNEDLACVGILTAPIATHAEEWLAARLPAKLESLPGLLLTRQLLAGNIKGTGTRALRKLCLFEAPGPFVRHWGPFFRRITITTDQILEEMFMAGDVQPAHALGLLVHLGGIAVDGAVPDQPADGARLAEVIERVDARRDRTRSTVVIDQEDTSSVLELKRFLRALYAGFVEDCEVKVYSPG